VPQRVRTPAYVVGNVKMVPITKVSRKPMLPTAEDARYLLRRATYAYFHDEPTGQDHRTPEGR